MFHFLFSIPHDVWQWLVIPSSGASLSYDWQFLHVILEITDHS